MMVREPPMGVNATIIPFGSCQTFKAINAYMERQKSNMPMVIAANIRFIGKLNRSVFNARTKIPMERNPW